MMEFSGDIGVPWIVDDLADQFEALPRLKDVCVDWVSEIDEWCHGCMSLMAA